MVTPDVIDEFFIRMKRCTKCILPETFPGITFDEQGVCNYCHSHEPIRVFGEQALRQKLLKYKNLEKTYDCIVPLSGGRDSSYVLYQMVTQYQMRVLAVTIDHGFLRPEGIRNVTKAIERLKVDHIWLKNTEKKIQVAKENCKQKFQGWLKHPSIHTIVPVLNAGDKTMNLQLFHYAHEHHIPVVVGGNNIGNSIFEQEHWKTGFLGVFPDARGYYSLSDRMKLSFLFGMEYLKNPMNLSLPIFKEYVTGASVYFFESLLKPKDVDTLGFYDYVYWEEQKIVSTIMKELDWQGSKDTTTTWRADDASYPLINYMYWKLVGFTEHDELYSKMVREGQVSRTEALQHCLSDQKPRLPSLQQMFDEFGVTQEQVDDVLINYRTEFLKQVNPGLLASV
ncbi:MAG: hypothetical protein WC525_06590 [Candidatus Thermoplasmatota archaeon]